MFKSLMAVIALGFGMNASANPALFDLLTHKQMDSIRAMAETTALNWKVGDTANYTVDMSIVQGTMVMKVTSVEEAGIWLQQDVDLGFAGKQNIQTLIDKTTGEVKKMIVNGEEQQVPEQNVEVISATPTQITVAAGTFDAFHVVAKDKSNDTEINVWINLEVIPMSGMIKQVQPSQFGEVTVELTSFIKN